MSPSFLRKYELDLHTVILQITTHAISAISVYKGQVGKLSIGCFKS